MKFKLKNENVKDKSIIDLVCENRGVDVKDLQSYLNPRKESIMSPLIYDNLDIAANKIINAIKNNFKIGVLVDSDVDGYCSAAMIINYIMETFNYHNIIIYMPTDKTHGLTPEIMDQIRANPVQLLIIPDASSSDYDQHYTLKCSGVSVIVIDHHEAEKYSSNAIVVNNQLSLFGNETLSGAGMVLKVMEHIDFLNNTNNAENYYDLAAVALVGDCMLMNIPETKYYVQQGLKNINNPLLMALYDIEKDRNYEMISFDIAPTINAFIRMGSYQDKQDLFAAMIGMNYLRNITIRGQGSFEIELPDYISKMASRIKSRQTNAVKKAIEHECTNIHTIDKPFTICILADEVSKNLTGLIGNRLVETYNKPAIVLKRKEGGFSGSGRTTDTFEEFRSYCLETGYFDFAMGHQAAFGVGISQSKLDSLLKNIDTLSLGKDADAFIVDKAYIDMVSAYEIMSIDELNNYWCRGFDKPQFYIKLTNLNNNVEIIGQKRNTIRIKHNHITYIKFKCSEEEIENIKNCNVNEVEIIGTFSVNEYYDNLYPQVQIEHLEFKGSEKKIETVPGGFGFDFSNFNQGIKW